MKKNIESNNIGNAGTEKIAIALEKNNTVSTLDLCYIFLIYKF